MARIRPKTAPRALIAAHNWRRLSSAAWPAGADFDRAEWIYRDARLGPPWRWRPAL